MKNLYYLIWVDCIKRFKAQPENRHTWQSATMLYMTIAMSFNFIFLMTILEKHVFKNHFYKIDFPILHERLEGVLNFLILFILPCWLLNYILIFRKKRYLKLLKNYPDYNGKISIPYVLISIFLPIVVLLVGVILSRF